MAVGIGIIGREVTINLGGSAVIGVQTKSIEFTNELLDSTDDDSNGWTEFLATPGLKSATFPIEGITKNLELMSAYFNASQIFAVTKTYPDGSVLSFDAALASYSTGGASNELQNYSASFNSSGEIIFTQGT